MKKLLIIIFILLSGWSATSQVIISLLFGDKLNSDKIEFGLDGGVNFSEMSGIPDAKFKPNFNLGFYFDFKMKDPAWMINTGVIVKSTMGARNLPVYPLNNTELDNLYSTGRTTRNLEYFNVPFLIKYQFENRIFVKAGPQFGLLYNANDIFKNEIDGNDLEYTKKVKSEFHPLDAGLVVGTGYRLKSGHGMNLGFHYYHGFVDVLINDSGASQTNKSFYVNLGIPIGVGKQKSKEN